MVDLAREHESVLLFAGILVAGLVVLLPSIHLAMTGEISVTELVLLALLAMWVSDLVWYFAGRFVPRDRLENLRFLAPVVRRVKELAPRFERRRAPALFFSRFLYGTRIPTCIACGLGRMQYGPYFSVNLASSSTWLALLFSLVSGVGSTMEQLLDGRGGIGLIPTTLVVLALFVQSLLEAARSRTPHGTRSRGTARRVSVVVPAYNEEAYLGAAISSVRNQAVPAEVVVVENGSTDGTAAIASRRADQLVHTAKPAGYSRARNLGAAVARGDLLVFLDADSRMGPDALEAILSEAEPGSFGTVLGRPDPPCLRYRLFFLLKNLGHRLGLYKGVLGGLFFFDAALYRRIGGFDESMIIDELHDISRLARRAGGSYRLVTSAWAATSMRRFDHVGLWSSFFFWVRLRCRLPVRRGFRAELEAYPAFRRTPVPREPVGRAPTTYRAEATPANEP